MIRISVGNCLDVLRAMPGDSVHCVVTSPPYWGLRDYGIEPSIWGGDLECQHEFGDAIPGNNRGGSGTPTDKNNRGENYGRAAERAAFCRCGAWRGAFGLEPTYQLFVDHAVEVFREVRRVLRSDGTLWLNLGDSYATGAGAVGASPGGGAQGAAWADRGAVTSPNRMPQPGLKPKDLCGIPWRVAFALQADGWYLRSDIIWSKPNPMPESVTDRPTKAHEYLFLMSKSERYHYDQDSILEECSPNTNARLSQNVQDQIGSLRAHAGGKTNGNMKAVGRKLAAAGSGVKNNDSFDAAMAIMPTQRNKRSVWTVTTQPFSEAHFATFPPDLVEPCIKAGCPKGGTVLDPFGGAGTTGLVADRLQRDAILIELNPQYAAMAERRLKAEGGMFCDVRLAG